MASQNPVVIIPGVFGSSLENFFEVDPMSTWSEKTLVSAALDLFDPFSLALDPTGLVDASLHATVRANGLIASAYDGLVKALRTRRDAPVYVFPYDWRLSTAESGEALQRFVHGITLKMARVPRWSGRIDFIAHSFGGLVFRRYLSLDTQASNRVGQVVMIAVPHRGVLDAAEAMIRGQSFLLAGRKELRKVARTFPSLYEILPTFPKAVTDAHGNDLSLFNLRNWQENVTPNGPDGAEANGFDVVQERLSAAQAQQASWRLPTDVVEARNLLTIYAGDPATTLVHVRQLTNGNISRWFDFEKATRGEGDGVVAEKSALLDGVASIRVSVSDASPLREFLARFGSLHAFMPVLDEVQSITSRFLDGARTAESLLPRSFQPDRYSEPRSLAVAAQLRAPALAHQVEN